MYSGIIFQKFLNKVKVLCHIMSTKTWSLCHTIAKLTLTLLRMWCYTYIIAAYHCSGWWTCFQNWISCSVIKPAEIRLSSILWDLFSECIKYWDLEKHELYTCVCMPTQTLDLYIAESSFSWALTNLKTHLSQTEESPDPASYLWQWPSAHD